MHRVLVTGAAGFIGSHLVDALLERGDSVVGIDNLLTGSSSNLAHLTAHPDFEFVQADVCSPFVVQGRLDRIYHLASPASPLDYATFPFETMFSNAKGTENALELARAKGARFLFTSTSEVYGDPLVHPQDESYFGNVNPVGPRSVYDESKRYGEALVTAYQGFKGVETRIARIFNTYGPRMRINDGRVIPTFAVQAIRDEPITIFGDGSQTRSYCYVSDLVRGLMALMESQVSTPCNLGNTLELSVMDLAKRIITMVGSDSGFDMRELPLEDPKVRKPNISLAHSRFGWEPQVSFEEGIGETIEFFRHALKSPTPEPEGLSPVV